MKFDLHTHHVRCGHAEGTIEDYIIAAMDAGLSAIGISDHAPYFYHEEDYPFPGNTMAVSEFKKYVDEVLSLKRKYEGKIEVLLGIESDFYPEPELMETYKSAYAPVPFDYIIGSVHFVNNVSIFNRNRWSGQNEEQQLAQKIEYYNLIAQSARSGMFNILGHIDAMKGLYPPFSDIPAHKQIDDCLQVIAECGVSIEINTSGSTKDCGGWYPSDDILERAHHYGVNVTFGSDAHSPKRVCDDFDKVRTRLKEIGFTQWVYYRNRQQIVVPL